MIDRKRSKKIFKNFFFENYDWKNKTNKLQALNDVLQLVLGLFFALFLQIIVSNSFVFLNACIIILFCQNFLLLF